MEIKVPACSEVPWLKKPPAASPALNAEGRTSAGRPLQGIKRALLAHLYRLEHTHAHTPKLKDATLRK